MVNVKFSFEISRKKTIAVYHTELFKEKLSLKKLTFLTIKKKKKEKKRREIENPTTVSCSSNWETTTQGRHACTTWHESSKCYRASLTLPTC